MILLLIKKMRKRNTGTDKLRKDLPSMSFIIPAYNEKSFLKQKIENTLSLDYPKEKLKIIVITDGSNDKPESIIQDYAEVLHLHEDARNGKFAAMNRAMAYVESEITVFTDANAHVNKEALKVIAHSFLKDNVGVVAGEKRIFSGKDLAGSTTGENAYWKYESLMKKLDNEFNSVIGAVGELFAIRTELFENVGSEFILDDFMLSLRINLKGYKTEYAPEAYAMECASPSIKEEYKRKVRIAAGGWQSVFNLMADKRIYQYPALLFQLLSRRAVRWMLAPVLLPVIFIANALLITAGPLYSGLMVCQVLFYTLALIGFGRTRKDSMHAIIKIPYYFSFMHYAALMGMFKFMSGRQTSLWEKAKRIEPNLSVTVD